MTSGVRILIIIARVNCAPIRFGLCLKASSSLSLRVSCVLAPITSCIACSIVDEARSCSPQRDRSLCHVQKRGCGQEHKESRYVHKLEILRRPVQSFAFGTTMPFAGRHVFLIGPCGISIVWVGRRGGGDECVARAEMIARISKTSKVLVTVIQFGRPDASSSPNKAGESSADWRSPVGAGLLTCAVHRTRLCPCQRCGEGTAAMQ
jgi:hypothetical protein